MSTQTIQAKFRWERTVATPGALEAIEHAGQEPSYFLDRHICGDWGTVCKEDWEANNQALLDGSRLLSAYETLRGDRVWVITEAEDDTQQRAVTTLLLPEEY